MIARNSSFAFRDQGMDVRTIGQALGATYLVKGSIRQAGQQIRVTVQLVEVATGTHLWAERYDRSLENIFAIQDDIARHVVTTVAQRIVDESEIAAQRRPPSDIRAYDLFLQGYRLSDTFRPDVQAQARSLLSVPLLSTRALPAPTPALPSTSLPELPARELACRRAPTLTERRRCVWLSRP